MSTLITGVEFADPTPQPEKISAGSSSHAPQDEISVQKDGSEITVESSSGQKIYKLDLSGAENFTLNFR